MGLCEEMYWVWCRWLDVMSKQPVLTRGGVTVRVYYCYCRLLTGM